MELISLLINLVRMAKSAVRFSCLLALPLCMAAYAACPAQAEGTPAALDMYEYSDTHELINMVQDAAHMLESTGEEAFKVFAVPGSRWNHGTTYIYVYTEDGDCLYNSGQPGLVGKNMQNYRDVDGRMVVQELMKIAARPAPDAADWVFFVFQDGNVLTPVWKTTYNMKTKLPDGRVVIVGSGRSSLKMERRFVTSRVDEAASLLAAEGRDAAFQAINDPGGRFNFLGSYVFVLDEKGETLVDPSFPNMPGRNLSGMTDSVGRKYIRELLTKIAHSDTASTMFFWRPHPNDVAQRKAIYARKVSVDGTAYIVGAEYLLPTPLWMK